MRARRGAIGRSSAVEQPEERCALAIGDAQTCTGDIPGSALMAGDAMCARRGEWEQREGVVTSYSHLVTSYFEVQSLLQADTSSQQNSDVACAFVEGVGS